MRGILRLSVFVAAMASAPTFAQGTADQRSNCTDDAYRFCNDDIPVEAKIERCLRANISHISPACRRELTGSSDGGKHKRGRR